MNNFTKEELKIISRDIEKFQEFLFRMKGKVLEMIDNYYEHEDLDNKIIKKIGSGVKSMTDDHAKDLVDRCYVMSYWLGFTWSALIQLANNEEDLLQKNTILSILDIMTPAMNKIFHNEE